jgi:hypothetical protein
VRSVSAAGTPIGDEALAALQRAVREVESHAASGGWDAPPTLYALVPTDDLVHREPQLAGRLVLDPAAAVSGLTPVEQEPLDADRPLDQVLPQIAWPAAVVGAAVVLERLVLPAAAEAELPGNPGAAERFAADHPGRTELRVAAGATREGRGHCVVRLRSHDNEADRLEGPDLVPGLLDLLAASLRPDAEIAAS